MTFYVLSSIWERLIGMVFVRDWVKDTGKNLSRNCPDYMFEGLILQSLCLTWTPYSHLLLFVSTHLLVRSQSNIIYLAISILHCQARQFLSRRLVHTQFLHIHPILTFNIIACHVRLILAIWAYVQQKKKSVVKQSWHETLCSPFCSGYTEFF